MGSLFLVFHLLHSNFTKDGRKGKIHFSCIKSLTIGFHWLWLCPQTAVQPWPDLSPISIPGEKSWITWILLWKEQYWAKVWQEMKTYSTLGICLTVGPGTLLWRFGYGQFTEWKSKLLLPYRKGITQGSKWKECLLHVYLREQRTKIWLGYHQTFFLTPRRTIP